MNYKSKCCKSYKKKCKMCSRCPLHQFFSERECDALVKKAKKKKKKKKNKKKEEVLVLETSITEVTSSPIQ